MGLYTPALQRPQGEQQQKRQGKDEALSDTDARFVQIDASWKSKLRAKKSTT
jgi:hypothetical protein